MKELQTLDAGQLDQILAALETDGAAYIRLGKAAEDMAELLQMMTAYLDDRPVPEADADRLTMFPSKLAIEPEMPARKVVQQYAMPHDGFPSLRSQLGSRLWAAFFLAQMDMELLTDKLLAAAARRYGFNATLARRLSDIDEWSLNAIQYVSVTGREGQMSFPTHRDWGLFTLYPAIGEDGLEIEVDGEFVSIPPNIDGRVLIYAGSAFQKFTYDKVRAARHHVKQKSARNRTVILYYADPPRDLLLPDGRTVDEFMKGKLRKIRQI